MNALCVFMPHPEVLSRRAVRQLGKKLLSSDSPASSFLSFVRVLLHRSVQPLVKKLLKSVENKNKDASKDEARGTGGQPGAAAGEKG